MGYDDFDWNDSDAVVIAHQGQVAVYLNPDGDVVVRQEGDWWRKDDAWIVVQPDKARRLCEAILALAEFGQPDKHPLALPAPADRTGADRQKRYRERKRTGVTAGRVTGEAVTRDGQYGRDGAVTRNAGDATDRDAAVAREEGSLL